MEGENTYIWHEVDFFMYTSFFNSWKNHGGYWDWRIFNFETKERIDKCIVSRKADIASLALSVEKVSSQLYELKKK